MTVITMDCPGCCGPKGINCGQAPYNFPNQFSCNFQLNPQPIITAGQGNIGSTLTSPIPFWFGNSPTLISCTPPTPPCCVSQCWQGVDFKQYVPSASCYNTGPFNVGPIQFKQVTVPNAYKTQWTSFNTSPIVAVWESQGNDYFVGTSRNLPWSTWGWPDPACLPSFNGVSAPAIFFDEQGYFSVPNPHYGCVIANQPFNPPYCLCTGNNLGTGDPTTSLWGYQKIGANLGLSITFILSDVPNCFLWCFVYVLDLNTQTVLAGLPIGVSQPVSMEWQPVTPCAITNSATCNFNGSGVCWNGRSIALTGGAQGQTGAIYCLGGAGLFIDAFSNAAGNWEFFSGFSGFGTGTDSQSPFYAPPTVTNCPNLHTIYTATLTGFGSFPLGWQGFSSPGVPSWCGYGENTIFGLQQLNLYLYPNPPGLPTATFPDQFTPATVTSCNPLVVTGTFNDIGGNTVHYTIS